MNSAARLAIVLVLAGIAVWQVDLAAAAGYFDWRQLSAIALVQPLLVGSFAFGGLRLNTLLGEFRTPFPLVLKATILAAGMNSILPGRLSELLKITYLRDRAGVPASVSLGAVILDRAIDILLLGVTATIGISLLLIETNALAIATMFVTLALFFLVPRLERPISRLCMMLPWAPLRKFATNMHRHVVERLRAPAIYRAFVYGVAIWALSFATVVVFMHVAGDKPIGLSGLLLIYVLAVVGGTIPALPGGFGTYEAAVVFALTRCGYTAEQALPMALALHVSHLLFGFAGTLFIASTEGIGLSALVRQLRNGRETEPPRS